MITKLKERLKQIKLLQYYLDGKNLPTNQEYIAGKKLLNEPYYKDGQEKSRLESLKQPTRTEIINFLLSFLDRETTYLEIGVRNPSDNYNHIIASKKYSVDPGLEFLENPVDFQMTSDHFFQNLQHGNILTSNIKFDIIFIDGLHLANQVDTDIVNALNYIKEDGFIVLHDCNPPTEWHAREDFQNTNTPAGGNWNGTSWKAFVKWRKNPSISSCCIDSDWGVGILSKTYNLGQNSTTENPFYEYKILENNRKNALNLISFEQLKSIILV